jgi:hypothetical protein
MSIEFDPEDVRQHLIEQDKKHGKNTLVDEVNSDSPTNEERANSLGKASTFYNQPELSAASESPWKLLNFESLPSKGMFYPKDAELLLRSAKTKEIRHWSTIDESDPLDVREKINFILNSCTRFKIKGNAVPLNFNDFLEIDRYHILFRIYELTFPNRENKLFANIKCKNDQCNHVNRTHVQSKNLKGFEFPVEIMKWYSPEERCFVIYSEKLGETLRIYMPTLGSEERIRQKRKEELGVPKEDSSSFYRHVKYLVKDWRRADSRALSDLRIEMLDWSENKFLIIHKFTDFLEKDRLNKAISICEKCRTQTESHIFLGGSFTVKDIFIISAGLDELI